MKDLEYLSGVSHLDKIAKGNLIYLPGDPADTVYFLKQGRVKISRLSQDGKQVTLLLLESGSFFGEMSLLEPNSDHENIAEAIEDILLCHTPKRNFEEFLSRNPKLSLKIMKLIGLRLNTIENRLEDILFLSAEARLIKLLRQLAHEHGQAVTDGVKISLKLTHQDLGQLIHVTRQTVTDILNQLQMQGLLSTERRYLILRPAILQEHRLTSQSLFPPEAV